MINVLVIFMALAFLLLVAGFSVWSYRDTRRRKIRNEFYDDFLKRKSEREKLRIPR